MHKIRQNEITDLAQQLQLSNNVIRSLHAKHSRERQYFIYSFQKFRNNAELYLHQLQEYFIYELIRVFDFSEAQQIKEHIKYLIGRSYERAQSFAKLRYDYEAQFANLQKARTETQDLKRQIEYLRAVNFQKEQVITDLQISVDRSGKTAAGSILTSQLLNDSGIFNSQGMSRTSSQSSLNRSCSPPSQGMANSPTTSFKQFRRTQQTSAAGGRDRLYEIQTDTKMTGDEVDFRQVSVKIIDGADGYKLTSNPTIPVSQQHRAAEKGAMGQSIIYLFENFKVRQNARYNDKSYISMVMPWIADVESSKQLLVKQHAALLQQYEYLTQKLNAAIAQSMAYKGNACLMQAAIDNAAMQIKDEKDKHYEDVRMLSRRIEELSAKASEAARRESEAQEIRHKSESKYFQLEQRIETLQAQLNQSQKRLNKQDKQDGAEYDEDKLQRKIYSLEEIILIYYKQMNSLCLRVKDLEYQNQDLLYQYDNEQNKYKQQLETLSNQDHLMRAEVRIKYYEEKLNAVTNYLFEQVQEFERRNSQFSTVQQQNSEQSRVIIYLATENKFLKRKMAEMGSRINQLVGDLTQRNFTIKQLMYQFYHTLATKDVHIEQLTRQISQSELQKMRFPPYMPKCNYAAYKDSQNRILSRQPKTDSDVSSGDSYWQDPDSIELIYLSQQLTSEECFDEIRTMVDSLQTSECADDVRLQSDETQTDEVSMRKSFKNAYCQSYVDTGERYVYTLIYINENDPALIRSRKEVQFLAEQVRIYEEAKVLEETKNRILVNTYEQYQAKVKELQDASRMQREDLFSALLRYKKLLTQYRSYPTVEYLKLQASKGFMQQIHDLRTTVEARDKTIAQRDGQLLVLTKKADEQFKALCCQTADFSAQVKMLQWYREQYYAKITQAVGRAAYKIEKMVAVIPPIIDYIKQLKQLLEILKAQLIQRFCAASPSESDAEQFDETLYAGNFAKQGREGEGEDRALHQSARYDGVSNASYSKDYDGSEEERTGNAEPGYRSAKFYGQERKKHDSGHLYALLAQINDFEAHAYYLGAAAAINGIRRNGESSAFVQALADDYARLQAEQTKANDIIMQNGGGFGLASGKPQALRAAYQKQFKRSFGALSRTMTAPGELPCAEQGQRIYEVTAAVYTSFYTLPEQTQTDYCEKQAILQSDLYLDAFNYLYETIHANFTQADEISALNAALRRQQVQYEGLLTDAKTKYAQRPPRDADAAVIYQLKIYVLLTYKQLEDYRKRYDALVAQFKNADGIVNLMLGGRANSVQTARREKWSLGVGQAYGGSLKKYV